MTTKSNIVCGYARVSTQDQNLNLQKDALLKYGCDEIFEEKISGKNTDRPELQKMLSKLRKGDQVVVYKLDRLGRSLKDLIDLTALLQAQGVDFISLQEKIDSTTATGRLVFNVLASLADFERDLIKERTMAGLAAARSRGIVGGRKEKLTESQKKVVLSLYNAKKLSVKEICDQMKISKPTLYKTIESENKAVLVK